MEYVIIVGPKQHQAPLSQLIGVAEPFRQNHVSWLVQPLQAFEMRSLLMLITIKDPLGHGAFMHSKSSLKRKLCPREQCKGEGSSFSSFLKEPEF